MLAEDMKALVVNSSYSTYLGLDKIVMLMRSAFGIRTLASLEPKHRLSRR